jgi:hypothetical protein
MLLTGSQALAPREARKIHSCTMRKRPGAASKQKTSRKPRPRSKEAESPPSPFNKIRHPLKRAFLAAFSVNGTLSQAAAAAKCDRTSHYIWEKEDPNYAEAFQHARRMFADRIEAVAVRLAVVGAMRKKFYKGKPIMDPETRDPVTGKMKQYVETEHSERMLQYQLEKRCRDIDQPGYSAHHRPTAAAPVTRTPEQEKEQAIAFFTEVANDTSQPTSARINAYEMKLKLLGLLKDGGSMGVEELAARLAEFNKAVDDQCRPPQ